jgi:copper chaperone NosL
MTKNLSKLNQYLVLLTGALMAIVYFTPLWYISLEAPQYPEGLSMYISINTISGGEKHDLQNINLLNHYIGMEEILSSSIPELLYMPYILGFMIFGAIVTFAVPRQGMVYLGILNLSLIAIAGLIDFWRWEYNYGHNLNPSAPIIVPGMAYQPPLLGCKEMLNITACSYPSIGVITMILGLFILLYIVYKEGKVNVKLI